MSFCVLFMQFHFVCMSFYVLFMSFCVPFLCLRPSVCVCVCVCVLFASASLCFLCAATAEESVWPEASGLGVGLVDARLRATVRRCPASTTLSNQA